MQNTEDGLGI